MKTLARSIIGILTAGLVGISASTFASAQDEPPKTFDQWQVACRTKDGAKECVIFSALINNKKDIVLRWAISVDQEKKNRMTITTLTGVMVPEGIAVRFGESEPVRIPYKLCMPKFCAAEIPFSPSWLKTFKASKGFSVTITAANGKEVKYDMSLNKFSAAYDFYTSQVETN